MKLGIFDHFGWAVAVTADVDHEVVDRRRIELVEEGVTPAPIHYDRGEHDAATIAELVAEVRASVVRATTASLDQLVADLADLADLRDRGPIESIAMRAWPDDFPTDIATLMRTPYEARADAVMYRQVLADLARARPWDVIFFDAKKVLGHAADQLGDRADDVLQGPRARMGPPWTKDHRVALAATVVGS